jgi:hypothetical protein
VSLQLYTICTQVLLQKDPPARSRLCEYIAACDNPVSMLQMRFQPITDRIKQVLPPAQQDGAVSWCRCAGRRGLWHHVPMNMESSV